MYEQIEIEIDDLLLDHENPRLGSVDSQASALRALISLSVRNFRTMMESIKEHGLDPGDLFYLVNEAEETGTEGYTVIDGNRRVGALMILRQPSLLAGTGAPENVVKRLREVTEGFKTNIVGESRTCVLFESRADAEDWILRRHGRNLEGEERISWGPLEIQRFQGDRSVLDLLDFVQRNGGYTPEEWAAIRSKLDRRSYVLRRFLESKAGRAVLSLGEEVEGDVRLPTSSRNTEYLISILKDYLKMRLRERLIPVGTTKQHRYKNILMNYLTISNQKAGKLRQGGFKILLPKSLRQASRRLTLSQRRQKQGRSDHEKLWRPSNWNSISLLMQRASNLYVRLRELS